MDIHLNEWYCEEKNDSKNALRHYKGHSVKDYRCNYNARKDEKLKRDLI